MNARDMLRSSVDNMAVVDRYARDLDGKHAELLSRMTAKRVGSPHFRIELGTDPPAPADLGHCPPEVVEVLVAPPPGISEPIRMDDLVSPLSVEGFYARQYPQRRPMLFRGPPARFAGLVDWTTLGEAMFAGPVAAGDVRLVAGNKTLPPDLVAANPPNDRGRLGRDDAVIDQRKVFAFLRRGATLIVDGMDRRMRAVGELADAMETAMHTYAAANLYASWRAMPGFDTHWDGHDVFIVQVFGRKTWPLFGPTRPSPTRSDVALDGAPPEKTVWEGDVEAGDVFYVPRGWWHDATVPAECEGGSIHLSCSTHVHTGASLVDWLEGKLTAHELFRREIPLLAPPDTFGAYLEAFERLLTSACGTPSNNPSTATAV